MRASVQNKTIRIEAVFFAWLQLHILCGRSFLSQYFLFCPATERNPLNASRLVQYANTAYVSISAKQLIPLLHCKRGLALRINTFMMRLIIWLSIHCNCSAVGGHTLQNSATPFLIQQITDTLNVRAGPNEIGSQFSLCT